MRISLTIEVPDSEVSQALAPFMQPAAPRQEPGRQVGAEEAASLPDVFTVGDVAKFVRVSDKQVYARSTVHEMMADGRIPSVRIGRLRRIVPAVVWDLVAQGGTE